MSFKSHCRYPWARLALGAMPCLILSACVSSPGPEVQGTGRCDDSGLGWAVGQPADVANMKRLSRESGAGLVNPVGRDSILRQDQRTDRLRVYIDGANIIQAARCE